MNVPTEKMPKIGIYLSEKKWVKLRICDLASRLLQDGYQLVRINLDEPLEEQGPFKAIVHKLCDECGEADQGVQISVNRIQRLQSYIKCHPAMLMVDPIENIRILMDRRRQYQFLNESQCSKSGILFTPPFIQINKINESIILERMKAESMSFPLVCKPTTAHGSKGHMMSLVFGPQGLKDIQVPCVAQTFINHDGLLFKIFVIGDKFFVIKRPSIKNLYPGDDATVHFDSHNVSKANCSSSLTILDEEVASDLPSPSHETFTQIVKDYKDAGMNLVGIDIIVERDSGRLAVIDVNFFPSYDGADNSMVDLAEMVISLIQKKHSTSINGDCKVKERGVDIDSGIDTSDPTDDKTHTKKGEQMEPKKIRKQLNKC